MRRLWLAFAQELKATGKLAPEPCDADMNHIVKKNGVRELRYHGNRIEDMLREGMEIEITKRRRVIAKLIPVESDTPEDKPDFLARLKNFMQPGG
jgi:antitoxin (DNA-binding transcriptional repressor) of toxin-antitoxin stability system